MMEAAIITVLVFEVFTGCTVGAMPPLGPSGNKSEKYTSIDI